jgi:hypothetical protein
LLESEVEKLLVQKVRTAKFDCFPTATNAVTPGRTHQELLSLSRKDIVKVANLVESKMALATALEDVSLIISGSGPETSSTDCQARRELFGVYCFFMRCTSNGELVVGRDAMVLSLVFADRFAAAPRPLGWSIYRRWGALLS